MGGRHLGTDSGRVSEDRAGSPGVASRVVAALREAGLTVATAESCTGGGIAARITSVPGSSVVFPGGVIAYANDVKTSLLGVPDTLLSSVGAVSEECAAAMAEGAARLFGAGLAVASTGIAGPGGGTARKPVGLVYLAVTGPGGTIVARHQFAGDRAAVTEAAVEAALAMVESEVGRR